MRTAPMRLLLALSLLAACGGDDDAADQPDAGFNCAIDQRDEEFTAGMHKTGDKGITFTIVSADPAPPARNDNAWLVSIADDSGPLEGAAVTIKPFMPDHNHGTSIAAQISETGGGEYQIDRINLFMPGIWEITLGATPAGGTAADKDTVVFTFCVAN